MKLWLTLFLFFLLTSVYSQVGFVSTGSSKNVLQKGEISYSIGEVGYVNQKSNGGSIDLGVQQTFQFIPVTAISDIGLFTEVYFYPNPTKGQLYLKNLPRQIIRGSLFIKIFSMSGKLMLTQPIQRTSSEIDVNLFTPGTYLMTLFQENKVILNYKFIKL